MRTPSGTGFTGPGKRLASSSPGPWKAWRRMSRHARAIRFIQTYCRPPKGKGFGQPLKLVREQKEWLEEALADGTEVAVLQTPRGNGKSTLGGGLCVWAVFDDDATGAPQVPIIATTITQAVRSCYGVGVSMIKAEPELLRRSLIYTGISQPRVVVPFNEGELFPVAADPDGLQGLDPSLALADEMGFLDPDSWASLQLATGKRERSLVVGLGTPGFDRGNAMHQVRQAVRDSGGVPGVVFHEHAAPDGCDVDDRAAWREANFAIRRGFLRASALEKDRATMPVSRFRIFRLGQWFEAAVDCWLGDDARAAWEGLTSPWDLVDGAPTWVGVDVGLKHDSTGIVLMQDRGDGRHHAVARIFAPTAEVPVDVSDVMQFLRDVAARYDVRAVSYDPRLFDIPAKYLMDEGLPMVEVPQSLERMTQAVGGVYEAIRAGRITHDGDAAFGVHVLNAVARHNERGFTLAKGKSRGKIDAAVALALAFDRVQRQDEPFRSVYEDRGVLAI